MVQIYGIFLECVKNMSNENEVGNLGINDEIYF